MPDQPPAGLEEPLLEARQGPTPDGTGQCKPAQEIAEIVGSAKSGRLPTRGEFQIGTDQNGIECDDGAPFQTSRKVVRSIGQRLPMDRRSAFS